MGHGIQTCVIDCSAYAHLDFDEVLTLADTQALACHGMQTCVINRSASLQFICTDMLLNLNAYPTIAMHSDNTPLRQISGQSFVLPLMHQCSFRKLSKVMISAKSQECKAVLVLCLWVMNLPLYSKCPYHDALSKPAWQDKS